MTAKSKALKGEKRDVNKEFRKLGLLGTVAKKGSSHYEALKRSGIIK